MVSYDRIIDVATRQRSNLKEKERQEEKGMEQTMEHNSNTEAEEKKQLQFVTIEFSRKQVDLENTTISKKNGKEYARIFAPGHGTLYYPVESIKESKDNPNRLYFMRPEGTELQIYYSTRKEGVPDSAPNSEKYEKRVEIVKIEDLKAAYEAERQAFIDKKNQERQAKTKGIQEEQTMERNNNTEAEGKKQLQFVTIEFSRKQVDLKNTTISEKNGKEYARIFVSDHGILYYPVESIKESKDNPNRLYFMRPEGTELQIYYSTRKEGVPDSAPNSEKYEKRVEIVKIEDLKAAYEAERQAFIDKKNQERESKNTEFVDISVPTEWVKPFKGIDNKNYAVISVRIPEGENKYERYSFIVSEERFKKSDLYPGNSCFVLPRNKKDSGEEYTITLKNYENDTIVEKEISSVELKEYMEAAVKRAVEEKNINAELKKLNMKPLQDLGDKISEALENKISSAELKAELEKYVEVAVKRAAEGKNINAELEKLNVKVLEDPENKISSAELKEFVDVEAALMRVEDALMRALENKISSAELKELNEYVEAVVKRATEKEQKESSIMLQKKKTYSFTQAVNLNSAKGECGIHVIANMNEPKYMANIITKEDTIMIQVVNRDGEIQRKIEIPCIKEKNNAGTEALFSLKREFGFSGEIVSYENIEEAQKYMNEAQKELHQKQNGEKETMKEESNKEDDPFMSVSPDEELPYMESPKEEKQKSRPASRHGR